MEEEEAVLCSSPLPEIRGCAGGSGGVASWISGSVGSSKDTAEQNDIKC